MPGAKGPKRDHSLSAPCFSLPDITAMDIFSIVGWVKHNEVLGGI